ncbi:MAG: hypothetical protein BWY92_01353 [Firmicutes bacterium ADurb.BinA052]|nr:MAG: hypothetical protein BWY92_01353 [Firmicutes bacterium ADurb.BinA052]
MRHVAVHPEGHLQRHFQASRGCVVEAPDAVVRVPAAQHSEDGGMAISCRDYNVGSVLGAICVHADGPIILNKYVAHPRAIVDLSAQLFVSIGYAPGKRERPAFGPAQGLVLAAGQEVEVKKHGYVGEIVLHGREGTAQERILETLCELVERHLAPFGEGPSHGPRLQRGLQRSHGHQREQVNMGKPSGSVNILLNETGIGRRQLLHVLLQTVNVGIHSEDAAVGRLYLCQGIVKHHFAPPNCAEFLP